MYRKLAFILFSLICLVGCNTTDSEVYSLVYYIPQTADDYYETASFTIGKASFDYDTQEENTVYDKEDEYSPLDTLDYIEESEYEPISMVVLGGNRDSSIEHEEGIGSIWERASVSLDDSEKFIDATCVYASRYAYFYVDNTLEYDIDEIIQIGTSFDSSYEIIRSVFGEEADVDNNGHVRFLITEFDEETMGFYYPLDQYSNEELRKADIDYISNESDVLYINSLIFNDSDVFNITDVYSTLAHEFSHMAYLNQRERKELAEEDSMWIVEGLAMWAEYLVGLPFGHDDYIFDYLSCADEIGLFEEERGEIYGYGLLFFRYLEEVYGRESIIALVSSEFIGTEAISQITGKPFEAVFEDFVLSLLCTATYYDNEYYLAGLNDEEKGFVFADEVYNVLSDKESYFNLDGEYSFNTDFFYPFSIAFFILDGNTVPDFESDKATIAYVEVEL